MDNIDETTLQSFCQLLELSNEEKRSIYKKCKKDELIEMLIINNNVLNQMLNEKADASLQINELLISPPDLNLN